MPGNRVVVRFIGEDSSLRRSLKSLTDDTSKFQSVGMAAFAAVATNMSGVIPAAVSLAGAVLLVPGAIAVAGAAMATFKIATAGVGDALGAVGEDAAKFNKAIKGLAPNAKSFVQAVRGLRGEWKDLQQAVQNRFFQGFAQDVSSLARTYIPLLKSGMTGIAGAMNGMARYAANALLSPAVVTAVNNVLGNTKKFLENATSSLGNFIDGFLKLASIGSDYLPAVGTWLANIARDFSAWVTANPDKIRGFIDGALKTFRDLWDIGVNLKDLFVGLFMGSSDGTTFLTILKDTTRFLADHAEVVKGVLYAMATLWVVGKVAPFASAVATAVGWLLRIGPLVGPIANVVGTLARFAAPAVAIGAVAVAVDKLIASVTGGEEVLPATLDNWKKAADGVVTAFTTWDFGPIFADVAAEWQQLVDGFVNGTSPIGAAFQTVVGWASALPGQVGGALASLPGIVGNAASAAWNGFLSYTRAGIGQALGAVASVPGRIMGFFAGAGGWLVGAGQAVFQGLWNGLRSQAQAVLNWISSVAAQIRNAFNAALGIRSPSKVFAESGMNIGKGLIKGLQTITPTVVTATTDMAGSMVGGMPSGGAVFGAAMPAPAAASGGGSGGGGSTVTFAGDTTSALASLIMKMIREDKIRIA